MDYTFGVLLLVAYLLGSIPWGLILTRVFAGNDIRLKGSGNIGATNVTRETGVIPGVLTLAGDILKGAVPVYLSLLAFGPIQVSGQIYDPSFRSDLSVMRVAGRIFGPSFSPLSEVSRRRQGGCHRRRMFCSGVTRGSSGRRRHFHCHAADRPPGFSRIAVRRRSSAGCGVACYTFNPNDRYSRYRCISYFLPSSRQHKTTSDR